MGDDGEEVPAYYHQWAAKIQDMSPARQADVLDQLGEDDRLIVQRILDHNAVQRSNDSAMSGLSSHARPASPDSPPPYSAVAGSRATKPASRQASRSVSPQEGHQSSAQTERQGRRMEDAHSASRGHSQQQKNKATSAVDMGIFDFDSQSSSEVEQQQPRDSQAHESRAAEEDSMRSAPPRQEPQAEIQSQRHQQQQGELLIP